MHAHHLVELLILRHKIANVHFRTQVYTRLDNTMCHEEYEKCFNTAKNAAEYVAYAAKEGEVSPEFALEKVSGA